MLVKENRVVGYSFDILFFNATQIQRISAVDQRNFAPKKLRSLN